MEFYKSEQSDGSNGKDEFEPMEIESINQAKVFVKSDEQEVAPKGPQHQGSNSAAHPHVSNVAVEPEGPDEATQFKRPQVEVLAEPFG